MSVGGAAACDEPRDYLDDRDLRESLRGVVARLCTEADVVDVENSWVIIEVGRIIAYCLSRAVRCDDVGVPACEVNETTAWPDRDACAALAALGREPIPPRVDERGHATCRLRPVPTDPTGALVGAGTGFDVDDWSGETVSFCGSGGTMLRITYAAHPMARRGTTHASTHTRRRLVAMR